MGPASHKNGDAQGSECQTISREGKIIGSAKPGKEESPVSPGNGKSFRRKDTCALARKRNSVRRHGNRIRPFPHRHPLPRCSICDGIALEGIHLIVQSLARAVQDGHDLAARGRLQLAAMMGGIAFQKDLGATHSLAHPLSSLCGLHHGTANALCLPCVMEWNAARRPGLYRRIGTACGLGQPDDAATIQFLRALLVEIGLPPGLRAYSVNESHLDALAAQAWEDGCHLTNPVPMTQNDLRQLYEQAL